MNPISLELTKVRLLGTAAVLAMLLALAAAAGWTVNGWRLAGPHATELAARDKRITDLAHAVDLQNVAIEAAGRATVAADDRRRQAEAAAARAIDRLGARGSAVASSTATDCAGVLHESWGAWR